MIVHEYSLQMKEKNTWLTIFTQYWCRVCIHIVVDIPIEWMEITIDANYLINIDTSHNIQFLFIVQN